MDKYAVRNNKLSFRKLKEELMKLSLFFLSTLSISLFASGIKNGDFEKWDGNKLSEWSFSTPVISKSDQHFSGEYSVLFTLTPEYSSGRIFQKISVKKDTVYELVFYFKKEKGNSILVYLQKKGKKSEYVFQEGLPFKDWTEKRLKFIWWKDDGEITLNFLATGRGKVFVDGVKLTEVGKRNPGKIKKAELLGNPGFEKYTEKDKIEDRVVSRNWRLNGGAPTEPTIIIDPEKAHSGNVFVKLEQKSEGSGAIYQATIPVNFHKKYRVSLWAKGEGEVQIMLYQYEGSKFLFSKSIGQFELTDEWKEYSGIYYPSSSLVNGIGFAVHFIGEIYLDDLSFKEVE